MAKFEGGGRALLTLYHALPRRIKRQAWLTVAVMLVGAFAEVLSIGAIVPFLAIVTDPNRAALIPLVGSWLGQLPPGFNLLPVTALAFIAFAAASTILRLVLTWVSQSFAFNVSYDLSTRAFRRVISQPYSFYLRTNSGEIVADFEKLHSITYTVLLSGVQAFVSTVIASLLIVFLLLLDYVVAISASVVLVGTYVLTSLAVGGTLTTNSETIALCWGDRIKKIQQAVGAIRDILIDSSQAVFESEYQSTANRLRRAQAINAFINIAPKIGIEGIGMVLVAGLAWYMAGRPGGVISAIPVLGALALGAQRLLPLLQLSYAGWSQFLGSGQNVIDVARLVELPAPPSDMPEPTTFDFCRAITLDNVNFGYNPGQPVLRQISLEIRKGERIGVVGRTGSGKSTLIDLLLGLLVPDTGKILVDGNPLIGERRWEWQRQVAHVPQAIYLADDSVAANIAFGHDRASIDMARLKAAAQAAGIDGFIESLPDGYRTSCGERGVRFSGGQRQRIGIARALYKRANVLIFDEATSALDTETEAAVVEAIGNLASDLTVVLIAHRLSTLKGCDRIIRLENGNITSIEESIAQVN